MKNSQKVKQSKEKQLQFSSRYISKTSIELPEYGDDINLDGEE
jgi:hypothetical protein